MGADTQIREMVFGPVKVRVFADGDVELSCRGALGRYAPAVSRMWCREQVEEALASAWRRPGELAVCEARALRWALQEMGR